MEFGISNRVTTIVIVLCSLLGKITKYLVQNTVNLTDIDIFTFKWPI